jgi:putative membrane protein
MMCGYGYGACDMMDWGGYGLMGLFGAIVWIVILALIIGGVVWLIRTSSYSHVFPRSRPSPRLDALEERYARGEINRDEYLEKRSDMAA